MNTPNPTLRKLIELVAADPQYHRRSGNEEDLARFWAQYPKESLDQLSMEDYVIGAERKPESFCWWIERGLESSLGRYMPGTSKGHLLYRRADGTIYKHRNLSALTDEQALRHVLKLQKVYATADASGPLGYLDDLEAVRRKAGVDDLVDMGAGRRLRLVGAYNPDTVLPIFSSDHINHYLDALGHPTDGRPTYQDIFHRHDLLYGIFRTIREQVPALTPYGFIQALYSDAMGIKPVREVPDDDGEDDKANWRPWDGQRIHEALVTLGVRLEAGKTDPSYAFEHFLGGDRYVYVKRKAKGVVKKSPLVIHPSSINLRPSLDQIGEVRVDWSTTVQNSSYRRFPRLEDDSQYGYAADVYSLDGLARLVEALGGSALLAPAADAPRPHTSMNNTMNLNQILYGPPGTGKTYKTTELAVQIAESAGYAEIMAGSPDPESQRTAIKRLYDELVASGRIQFTTFHQSFSYEDFIEGLRAETDERGNLAYRVADGLFKRLAVMAGTESAPRPSVGVTVDIGKQRIWKMSLGNTLTDEEDTYQDCIDNGYIALGWGDTIDFRSCHTRQAIADRFTEVTGKAPEGNAYNVTAVNAFKNTMRKNDIVVVSDGNQKFRAIGLVTGDYEFSQDEAHSFRQRRPVRWLRVFDPSLPREVLFSKALSQMTIYELKPSTIKVDELNRLLAEGAKAEGNRRNYVLIIDEINRGNIARIFGELITLLEPDKRQGRPDAREATLPYSKERFSVPDNLYVIGTMNTADKSLSQIDHALRRRFAFTEMLPEPEMLDGITAHGVDVGELLRVMNHRIEYLLDRDHLLGHSYFLRLAQPGIDKNAVLAQVFENHILPLLQEYFFSDWERIRWVLNDIKKSPDDQFVQMLKDAGTARPVFAEGTVPTDMEDRRYRINPRAFRSPQAYRGILG
jgi:5-methylcytosine-specific restriction protein B